jgi:hypothetical protein
MLVKDIIKNYLDTDCDKVYIMMVTTTSKTTETERRFNYNFSSFELVGHLERAKHEIFKQISGEIKPTVIERTVET